MDKLQTRSWTQQKQLKSKHFWRPQRPQQEWCPTDLEKVQERQLGMCLQLQGTAPILLGMCSRFERPLIQLPLSLLEPSRMLQKLETFSHFSYKPTTFTSMFSFSSFQMYLIIFKNIKYKLVVVLGSSSGLWEPM